jgi:hypothetical protein
MSLIFMKSAIISFILFLLFFLCAIGHNINKEEDKGKVSVKIGVWCLVSTFVSVILWIVFL